MCLFVYGPYMNPKYLYERGIEIISSKRVFLRDYDICFSTKTNDWKNAMIDIIESEGNKVEGVLYGIDYDSMKIFDELEKLSAGKHQKINVEIETENGSIIEAQTFISTKKEGNYKPSKKYIDIIIEGAKINNLSSQHIEYLREFL